MATIAEANRLYQQYVVPLEKEHRGKYVAVFPNRDGNVIIGTTLLEVVERATATFGPGSFVFKVGEKAVGKWR